MELEDTALSYDEWKSSGYYVRRGEKSKLRDALGQAQFTADQVIRYLPGGGTVTRWEEELKSKPKPEPKPTRREPPWVRDERKRAERGNRIETLWEKADARARAKKTPFGVVEDFDSFVRESGMLPDLGRRTVFAINDPLEMHFMNVADKHGILDAVIDGEEGDYY